MDNEQKFFKERNKVLEVARKGIQSNIPLSGLQKKYLKNLLLYSLMNASGNESVTNRNFIKLVNKLFKKFIIDILKKDTDDDDDFGGNIDVDLNKIVANAENLNLEELQKLLTPGNVIAIIKANTKGLSKKQILNKILALRDIKTNHRETPEEAREREQRQKEYEMIRQRQRMMEYVNPGRERSRS